MIKSILKTLFLSAVVLLVGQIPVGRRTIASHFASQVKKALRWSGKGLSENALVARLSTPRTSAVKAHEDEDRESEVDGGDPDGVTASDRESLLRLLQ